VGACDDGQSLARGVRLRLLPVVALGGWHAIPTSVNRQSGGPRMRRTCDLRVAVGLAEMGCVELQMRQLDEALAHTAEAARTVPRDGVHGPEARGYVAQVLLGFAAVRASARKDLLRAADLAAEAIAIREELARQSSAQQRGRLELARRVHARILHLPANPVG
jgi:hypothetical protein